MTTLDTEDKKGSSPLVATHNSVPTNSSLSLSGPPLTVQEESKSSAATDGQSALQSAPISSSSLSDGNRQALRAINKMQLLVDRRKQTNAMVEKAAGRLKLLRNETAALGTKDIPGYARRHVAVGDDFDETEAPNITESLHTQKQAEAQAAGKQLAPLTLLPPNRKGKQVGAQQAWSGGGLHLLHRLTEALNVHRANVSNATTTRIDQTGVIEKQKLMKGYYVKGNKAKSKVEGGGTAADPKTFYPEYLTESQAHQLAQKAFSEAKNKGLARPPVKPTDEKKVDPNEQYELPFEHTVTATDDRGVDQPLTIKGYYRTVKSPSTGADDLQVLSHYPEIDEKSAVIKQV